MRGSFVIVPGSTPQAKLAGSDATRWTQRGAVEAAWHAYGGRRIERPRRKMLLFWGSVRMNHAPAEVRRCLSAPRTLSPPCERLYSRGIRQLMWSLYANDSFCDFRSELPSIAGARKGVAATSYREGLLTTEYCLDSPGNGALPRSPSHCHPPAARN